MATHVIVVHGGAGQVAEPRAQRVLAGVTEAARAGFAALREGRGPRTAVVEAVAVLEDLPEFNAGRGSVLNAEGEVEMDAALMEGTDLRAGAVALVRDLRNPIKLAEAVLDHGSEVFLAGDAAEAWARQLGLERIDPEEFRLLARKGEREGSSAQTVGAVACDAFGRVAAATSTGGLRGKRPGRIGDSPILGAGTYADDCLGAISATGNGEAILRFGLARFAACRLATGRSPSLVAREAIREFFRRTGAEGGMIIVDPLGRWGCACNSPHMPIAWIVGDEAQVHATLEPQR